MDEGRAVSAGAHAGRCGKDDFVWQKQEKKWVFGIGLYLIVKSVLNLILGFSGANIVMLILAVAALVLMLGRIPYIQYIVAVWLVLMFLVNLGGNLSNLGSQWIYLLEGLLDVGAAAVLVFEKNVKAFFGK